MRAGCTTSADYFFLRVYSTPQSPSINSTSDNSYTYMRKAEIVLLTIAVLASVGFIVLP
jgi:hypothetical protein